MTVRDPGFEPRHPPPGPRPAGRRRWIGPALIAVALVAVLAIGFGGGLFGANGPSPSAPSGPVGGRSAGTSTGPSATPAGSGASAGPSGSPAAPGPTPTATPVIADVPIVPVTNFRSFRSSVGRADVDAIAGGEGTYSALVLVDADADPILAALGLDRAILGDRLVTVADASALARNLSQNRTRLGFERAPDVDASVRALAWGGAALYGVDRVRSLAGWPLTARLPASPDAPAYDPAHAWTLVAGGDILLDRGVSLAIRGSKRGANFPFDGGTVDITGHCKDCSPFGWDLPYTSRTGNGGAVRDLIHGADVAIANFENPAPDSFRFHASGTSFSANPKYIAGLRTAGIDWVSVANNHIGDAGRAGILQTLANLDRYGIEHSGAGKNTAAAHKAALLDAGGVTIGLLGYDSIAPVYNAGSSRAGSARLTKSALKKDVAAARKAGADLVIVFPHWGVEYNPKPFSGQQALAHAAIDAGADMVIGNHAHWAGAMEVYEGKPIWYALGNFVFDQTWSEPTMEGITLELTFDGTRLVQVRLRPHLILDRAQPNFLDPAGDGKVVLSQIFRASKGLLSW